LRVVEGAECVGADALDVPEVEELVRDQSVEAAPVRLGREAEASEGERGRVEVFESAAARRAEQEYESVIVVWNLAHHLRFGRDDFLNIAPNALGVEVAVAVNDVAVRDAV